MNKKEALKILKPDFYPYHHPHANCKGGFSLSFEYGVFIKDYDEDNITLDGHFTLKQLKAIIYLMENLHEFYP